jgi:HNH endonuclease
MDERFAEQVRARAGYRCEYCHIPDAVHPLPFEIEHVIPQQHGGRTSLENLAHSCLQDNRHKGPNLAGIDRQSSRTKLVRLFNPRTHKWPFHFHWDGGRIVGRTAIGRVTVTVLAINEPERVALRVELIRERQIAQDE